MEELAAETEHFTGADLQAVLYTAQLKAIHQRDEPTTTGDDSIKVARLFIPKQWDRRGKKKRSSSWGKNYDLVLRSFFFPPR